MAVASEDPLDLDMELFDFDNELKVVEALLMLNYRERFEVLKQRNSRNNPDDTVLITMIRGRAERKRRDDEEKEKKPVRLVLESLTPEDRLDVLMDSDSNGFTPMHVACMFGDTDTVREIIEAVADDAEQIVKLLSLRKDNGSTPLHVAARSASVEFVSCLLEVLSAEEWFYILKITDVSGGTPLHYAARNEKRGRNGNTVCQVFLSHLMEYAGNSSMDKGKPNISNIHVLRMYWKCVRPVNA